MQIKLPDANPTSAGGYNRTSKHPVAVCGSDLTIYHRLGTGSTQALHTETLL